MLNFLKFKGNRYRVRLHFSQIWFYSCSERHFPVTDSLPASRITLNNIKMWYIRVESFKIPYYPSNAFKRLNFYVAQNEIGESFSIISSRFDLRVIKFAGSKSRMAIFFLYYRTKAGKKAGKMQEEGLSQKECGGADGISTTSLGALNKRHYSFLYCSAPSGRDTSTFPRHIKMCLCAAHEENIVPGSLPRPGAGTTRKYAATLVE